MSLIVDDKQYMNYSFKRNGKYFAMVMNDVHDQVF